MKFSIFLLFVAISGTSCSKYSYMAVHSDLPQNEKGEFFVENDTFKITYRFSGLNAPMRFTLENTSSSPLYINLEYSSVIKSGKAVSHMPSSVPINATFEGQTISWNSVYSSTDGVVTGSIGQSPRVILVPPKAYIESSPFHIYGAFPNLVGTDAKIQEAHGYRLESKEYSREETPLIFRNYLMLDTEPDFSSPNILDNVFWVGKATNGYIGPSEYYAFHPGANVFYVTELTEFTKVTAGILLVGGTIGCLVLAANQPGIEEP